MSKSINQQVFYDPTGKRWRLSLSLGLFIGIILLTLISLTINNVFRIYSINSTIRALTYDSQRSKNIQRDIITNYTYTYEEYVSFKEQSDIIDQVFFNSARPELQDGQINLITKSGEEFERIHKFINDNTPSINSNLQISDINYDKKYYEFRDNSYTLTTLINNQKYHSNFIKQIKKHILDQNYSGVSLSFREITFADIDKNSLYSFIEELDSVLPQSRINLSIPTEADISKVKQVISKVDSLTIQINPIKNSFAQTKDLNQIDQNVQKLLKEFSNLPVSLMISSDNAIFTYQNNELISNQPISYSQIGDLISKNGLKISSDENQPQKPNYLEYSQDGYDFKIVLTDSVYHYNTLHLLDKSLGENVTAIGYSDLGFEDPLSWDIINTNDINVRQEIIQKLKFNTFIDKKGIGDIVTPSADPVFGERKIEFQDNLAVHQEIITLPKMPKHILHKLIPIPLPLLLMMVLIQFTHRKYLIFSKNMM
ncbi:hypothetical protein HC864_05280 [Candidatus Gracilibacteria bacterium]|nr:hypothetical protein [Candidatus Gracilibacteria bacterium]